MKKPNKTAYAIYKKGKLVDCHFIKGVAVAEVDAVYGNGLFSRSWDDNKKGDYEIVECECEYDRVYVVDSNQVHSEEHPTIFPSVTALTDFLKEREITVKKKGTKGHRFTITTNKGVLKGRMMNVK